MVEFRLLGPLDAGEKGSAALGGRKQRTLLAYLLLHRNKAIPRETLIDALWPEDPPPTAAHALDVYVSRLRKSLGADGLQLATGRGAICLDVTDDAVDAGRFEQFVAAARRAESPADRLVALEQALALWRGRALADLLEEPSLRPERERLEEERLVAEEDRFDAMLALGRPEETIGGLQTLAAEHPLRERPRRLLMLALYRAGRQGEALEVYRNFRRLLSEELGLEPSADFRELEAAVLRQDQKIAAPASATRSTASRGTVPAALVKPDPSVEARPRSRRALVVIVALAVAAGVFVGALALSRGGSARPTLTVPSNSVAAIDPATGRVVQVRHLQDPPVAAIAVGGTVWIASWVDRTLTSVDDRTGKLLSTIGLPCRPLALAYGDRHIWIASYDKPCSLTAFDPRSGNVVWSKQLHQPGLGVFAGQGWGAHGVAFANGSVWVTLGVSGLVRVSPDGRVEHNFAVGPDATAIASDYGAIWVAILGPEQLVEIDPGTNSIAGHVNVGAMEGSPPGPAGPVACSLAGSGSSVWAPAGGEGESVSSGVWRVDAIRRRVSGVTHMGGNPCGVALGHGKVWVTNPSSYQVDEISPRTGLVHRIALDSSPSAIAAAPEHVWVITD